MNIFRHEMSSYRKSLFIWMGSLAAVLFFYMSILPGMAKDAKNTIELLEGYPPDLLKALGVQIDTLTSTLGFFGYVMGFLLFVGAIQGMNLGLSLISKETRMKTADFLLTKPISRTKIFVAKFLSGKVSLILTNIVFIGVVLLTAAIFKSTDFAVGHLILMALTLFLVQLFFFTFGLCLSTLLKKVKSVIGPSIGIVALFYVLSMFGSIIGDDTIRYFTPFQYFHMGTIAEKGVYEWKFFALDLALCVIFTIVAFVVYKKKDIQAV